MVAGDDPKREKRTKQIRITERTYDELAKLGNVKDDWEDVISRLLKHYNDTTTGGRKK
jgi:predicted CopG family antitoxin